MKRFLSFIIWAVLISVLSFHNQVMAFWDNINISMWNHMTMDSQIEKCHWNDIKDCESICCINTDFTFQNSNINITNNKKLFDKLKYNFFELSFDNSFIHEWNLIWNTSPPILNIFAKKHEYIALTWIIKSNT